MATNFYKVGGSYYTTTGQKILNLQQLQSYAQAGGREVSAPAVPQGATLLSGPSQLQGLTESQIFRQGQNIYRLPQVVSSNQFNQQQSNIQPVNTQDITPNITGLMAGVQTSNEGLQNILTEQQRALQSQDRKTEVDRQLEQYTQQVQGQQRELQEQKLGQYGAQQNLEQLQAIMPQIARIQADYNRIAEENLNRPISSRIIGGTADRIQRQKAVELAGLSAVAQAYQGNVEMARVMAQDAINAQYQDQTNYFNALKTQLDSIEADLSREEKVKFDQLKTVIADRERLIEKEINEAERKSDLMIAVAQKGADAGIIRKIQNAKTYEDAIILAQPFLKESISINDQMTLLEGGYKIGADGQIQVDTSSASASQIANAIKTIESNNNYSAKGASGEYGAYQFMPGTWDSWSSEYAREVLKQSARRLNPTPENQDAVAIFKINQWLSQGLSPEQIAAKWNSGSEIGWEKKIGVNKQGVAYNVPNYVNKFISTLGKQLGANKGEVSAMVELQASTIVTQISPRLANNKELIAQVAQLIASGAPMDDIEDELRYLSQSEKFEPWRNLANTAFSGVKMAVSERTRQLDIVDDYIASGDNAGAMEHIKTTILGAVGATEKKNVTGRDDALTSVYEIERLLDEYTSMGGNTGLLTGKVEDFNKKVLKRTGNSELAYIANEIAMAIQKYRQDLTGAAFTESEAKEYNSIFPSIGKSPTLNRALINSLKSQYERNQRKFWERQLGGTANYNKLQNLAGTPIVGVGDLSRFSTSNPMPITNNYLTNLGY